jgi:hypothetical protein
MTELIVNPVPSLTALVERLSAAYGFAIPQSMGELVLMAIAWEEKMNDPERIRPHYTGGIGFDLAIFDDVIYGTAEPLAYVPTDRYEIEPPEFFAFGHPWADGIAYGYVVRAPELNAPELPVYEMEPLAAAIELQGASTAAAVAYLYDRFGTDSDTEEPLRLAALELAAWSAKKVLAEIPPVVLVPEHVGYRFESSDDGVGVFAARDRLRSPRRIRPEARTVYALERTQLFNSRRFNRKLISRRAITSGCRLPGVRTPRAPRNLLVGPSCPKCPCR